MFQTRAPKNTTHSFFAMAEVTYHTIVKNLRGGHRNAIIGLVFAMLQGVTLVLIFYGMFLLLGVRGSPVRGDFLLYIMSGVFLFMTHVNAVSTVAGAGSPLDSMMLHPPMNTIIAITAAAVASLYQQFLTVVIVLLLYHIIITPITIDQPMPALGMFVLAWFTGCVVGLLFLALTPWLPNVSGIAMQLYRRLNMIASGKMFLANALPSSMIAVFDWNPLFHIIDQARGFIFLHYNPFQTSLMYPIYVGIAILMIGLMAEFFTRQHVSASWFAGR